MRTHIYNKMTAEEVEAYLASGRNAIFIPVGVTEIHGEAPVDIENTIAEAYALAMAEQSNSVCMINLPYFYPGGTAIGSGTVHTSIIEGIEYLTQICKSLVDQGFKKLILIPGHSSILLVLNAFSRDFFEATHIHPVVVSTSFGSSLKLEVTEEYKDNQLLFMNKILSAGAYKMMKQLQYLPVNPDVKEQPGFIAENDPALRNFADRVRALGGVAALAYSDTLQHGGGYIYKSVEELNEAAEIGEKAIRNTVEKIDFRDLFDTMDDYQDYVKNVVCVKFPRFDKLP